ncbi:MAG: hypothetical protein JKY71_11235 [Alphaproteobacteria bacterium]|nr:hypothetical protein [Alphaproteobacteria bacterium]
MIKKWCLLLCAGLFFSASASFGMISEAQAQTMRCRDSNPSLSVKTATTRTKYVRTKSAKDLTDLHGGGGGSVIGGLGGGEIGFRAETKYSIETVGKQACVKLERVEVKFYAKPEIHVASNFSRNSCEYAAVLNHENGHIRILRKFVREYSPKVKRHMIKVAKGLDTAVGPIPATNRSVQRAQEHLQKEFVKELGKLQEKIMPVLAKRQKAHDNPREYARVDSKCRKWDQKLSN